MGSYITCLFLSDLFHLAKCPWYSSMLSQKAHSFFIHLLMDPWVVSMSWLLEDNTAVNMTCRYLFNVVILFPSDIYYFTEMELLNHMVVLLSIFLKNFHAVNWFSLTLHKDCLSSTSSPILVISCLFDNSHSNRCEIISHYGSVLHFSMISDIEHHFTCLLAIWQNVRLDPLPIFKFGSLLFIFLLIFCSCIIWFLYILWGIVALSLSCIWLLCPHGL